MSSVEARAEFPLEQAVVFDCRGEQLLGVVHHADPHARVGLLAIVAGGPQYRGGCGRQLVELGRRVASVGIPVMRFDHRGLGDSSGEFRGFEDMEDDIAAAIVAFRGLAPGLEAIVLWGGCDAASAALINAHRFPEVRGIIASNPWITTAQTLSQARRRHYITRLGERSFWAKLLRMEYNPIDYLKQFVASVRDRARRPHAPTGDTRAPAGDAVRRPFLERMLGGLETFDGSVLFIMSGRSIISTQFDELIRSDRRWQRVVRTAGRSRVDIEDADQTFSTRTSRALLLDNAIEWLSAVQREHRAGTGSLETSSGK